MAMKRCEMLRCFFHVGYGVEVYRILILSEVHMYIYIHICTMHIYFMQQYVYIDSIHTIY